MNIIDQLHRLFKNPYSLTVTHDKGEGNTIIFLHGIANESSMWQHVIAELQNDYRIISVDVLGFGASPKPSWSKYSLKDHAKSVIKTIKKHRIHGPVILAGHSLGGLIAIEIADRYPSYVSKLILVAPPIYDTATLVNKVSPIKNPGILTTNVLFQLYTLLLEKKDLTLKAAQKYMKLSPKETGFTLTEQTWVPFTKSLSTAIMQQQSLRSLQRLTQPVTVIYGTLDSLIVPRNYTIAARINKNIRVVRYYGGHFINKQAMKRIAETLAPDS